MDDNITKALLLDGTSHGWTTWVRQPPEDCPTILVTLAHGRGQDSSSVPAGSPAWDQPWYRYDRILSLPSDDVGLYGYWYVGPDGAAADPDSPDRFRIVNARILSAGENNHWTVLQQALAEVGLPPLHVKVRDAYRCLRSVRGSI